LNSGLWAYKVGTLPLQPHLQSILLWLLLLLLQYWDLNSGPRSCQAGILPLEPLHQLFFILGVFEIGSCKIFA
jgi:hypothetical protein